MKTKPPVLLALTLLFLAATSLSSRAQLLWQVGKFDGAWSTNAPNSGGLNTAFVQENGSINDLPGDPNSPAVDGQADNDYYFAGSYTTTIPSVVAAYIDYTPVGTVAADEQAAERAFAGADDDWRVHFNLPSTLKTNDMLYVTWANNNLDGTNPNPFYGISIWINGLQLTSEIVISNALLYPKEFTSPQVSLASVNAQVGPGFDNIVSLKGYNHNADGGGNWMGIDAASLTATVVNPTNAPPALPLLWTCGLHDNAWPQGGTGGGANAVFVQETGTVNPLPGSPTNPAVDKQADSDYYFAGSYTTTISSVTNFYGMDYTPVGTVAANETAAERAFAGDGNELRYHFNLPSTLKPFDLLSVQLAPHNLDTSGTDARYGVEIYVNGVLVDPQILVRSVDLERDIVTPQFRLDSVNAQVGPGFDNIVTLKAYNYSADGGGSFMGIDYVQLNAGAAVGVIDTNPPTIFAVTRGGDDARLVVTFSEKVTAVTANAATNYVLTSGTAITLAVLQPNGTNVLLTTAPISVGTADSLTVTEVKDLDGNPMPATTKPFDFTTKYKILFVTADPGPLTFPGDQAVLSDLQARGYDVTLSTGTAVPDDGSTAIGKDLVIVSSSLASTSVVAAAGGAKFLHSPVPVIDWEPSLEDDFGFQAANGTTMTNQTQINIVDASSPLAAGFPTGPLTVTTSPQTISQGTPTGAHIVAKSTADPTQAVIYYYEKGETGYLTNGYTMPARRVFLFLNDNTFAAVNAAGTKLFDAAVDFAVGVQPTGNTNAPTVPMLWTCGIKDNAQPTNNIGGGPNANFVQETGSVNPLPGSADSTPDPHGADNDYYFAGSYTKTIPSVVAMYGDYTPLGTVAADEDSAERAVTPGDYEQRYHFNLPTSLKTNDVLSVTFAGYSLDGGHPDPRYGIIGFINGVLVQPEIVIRLAQLEVDYTTPAVTLASVNAQTGPGADNIVTLRGVDYSTDGGGSWLGFDYIQMNGGTPTVVATPPKFLPAVLSAGKITLSWTGVGSLESAPAILGPWTPVAPAPSNPYSENVVATQNRFYRLKAQ
jgi:hypothetical protein